VVVQIVYVVNDIIPDGCGGSSLEFEYYRVAMLIFALCVDLRSQKHLTSFHIAVVVFANGGLRTGFREVRDWIEDVVLVEVIGICRKHLLHVLAHLKQHFI
jgi:hypothetical protein